MCRKRHFLNMMHQSLAEVKAKTPDDTLLDAEH